MKVQSQYNATRLAEKRMRGFSQVFLEKTHVNSRNRKYVISRSLLAGTRRMLDLQETKG